MSELFPIEAVAMDSPRLAWMKRHGIITLHHRSEYVDPTWFAGRMVWWPGLTGVDFFAEETALNGDSRIGQGETEDEALVALAARAGLKHWSEEGGA